MKNRMWMMAAVLVTGAAFGQTNAELKDLKARVGYGIGMNLGSQFRRDEVEIDPEMLLRGLKESMAGQQTLMTETEMRTTLQDYSREIQAKRTEKRRVQGEKNRAEGTKFLEDNKGKPGVVVLPSGLQYKVLQAGQGESPKSNDTVSVHYRGRLLDGTEFDSSYSRAKPGEAPTPATFGLNRVIKGWTEGLQLMKAGSKYEFYIPSELAYGEGGSGKIGPNSTLVFEVELVSFKTPEMPPTPPAPAAPAQAVTSDIIKVPSKEEMEKGAKIEIIKKEDAERMIREQQEKKAEEKK